MSPEELNTTAMAEFGNYIQEGTKLSFLCNLLLNFIFVSELKAAYVGLEYNEQIFILFFLQKGLAGKASLQQGALV